MASTSIIARYQEVVSWLVRDAHWRFRKDFILALIFSGASLVLQFGALAVLYYYLRAAERAVPLTIAGRSIEPSSLALLLITAVAVLILLGSGIVLNYLGRIRALFLGRSYEEFCSRRAIELINSRGQSTIGIPERRAIHNDSRICGRVATILVAAVLPMLFALVATGVLFVTDPIVTLWLTLLVLLASPFLYWVNVRGARFTQLMERTSIPAVLMKRSLVSSDKRSGAGEGGLVSAFRSGPLKQNLDAYVGRRRAVEESGLVTGILMSLALVLILAQQGHQILATGKGLSSLAVYLITLRLQLTNLTKTMRVLTSVNRFYPQIARHRRFLLGIDLPQEEVVCGPDDDDELEDLV